MSDGTQLGTLLCQQGLITQAQLDAALAEQAASGKPLGRVLIELGNVSETDLVRTLAKQVGLEFVDLSEATIDPSVAGAHPREPRPQVPGAAGRLGRRRPARRRDG